MAVGIRLRTNKGLENIENIIPFREIDRRRIVVERGNTSASFTFNIGQHRDFSGKQFRIIHRAHMVRFWHSSVTNGNWVTCVNGVPDIDDPYGASYISIKNNYTGNTIGINRNITVTVNGNNITGVDAWIISAIIGI